MPTSSSAERPFGTASSKLLDRSGGCTQPAGAAKRNLTLDTQRSYGVFWHGFSGQVAQVYPYFDMAGDPAAQKLRLAQIPVFTVAVGSRTRLPDLELTSLDCPTVGVAGKPVRVPFTIQSSLPTERVVGVRLAVAVVRPSC